MPGFRRELLKKRADPFKRKVALDREAISVAALYAAADDARRAYYSDDAESNPNHRLGKEIVQSFVQVRLRI